MAKNKLDDFDFDDDLNFDDDLGFGTQESRSKKNKPITDVFIGAKNEALGKLKDRGFIEQTVKKMLPKDYEDTFDKYGEVAWKASHLYDNALKELKAPAKSLVRNIDKLVSDENKKLKSITKKLADIVGLDEESRAISQEQQEEISINNTLSAVFQSSNTIQASIASAEAKEREVRDRKESKRFEASIALFSSMNQKLDKLVSFNEQVSFNVQKKSLEIQLRSYFLQARTAKQQSEFYKSVIQVGQALVKNTALSEEEKIRESARFKKQLKEKLYNKLQTGIFGSDIVTNVFENFKEKFQEFKDGLVSGLEFANAATDAAAEARGFADENNISKSQIFGEFIAGNLMDGLSSLMGKVSRDEFKSNPNSFISKVGHYLKTGINNPAAMINKGKNTKFIKNLKSKSKLTSAIVDDVFYEATDLFRDRKGSTIIKNNRSGSSLLEPSMGLTNKTVRTIEEVIPGYLSRILREVTIQRTGDPNISLLTYDFTKANFLNNKERGREVTKVLDTAARSGLADWRLDDLYYELAGNKKFDKSKEKDLKRLMLDISTNKILFTKDDIEGSGIYNKYDADTVNTFKELMDIYVEEKQNDSLVMRNLENRSAKIRNDSPKFHGVIEQLIEAGYQEELLENGIIQRLDDGDYRINSEISSELVRRGIIGDSLNIQSKYGLSQDKRLNERQSKTINVLSNMFSNNKKTVTNNNVSNKDTNNYAVNIENIARKINSESGNSEYQDKVVTSLSNINENILKLQTITDSLAKPSDFTGAFKDAFKDIGITINNGYGRAQSIPGLIGDLLARSVSGMFTATKTAFKITKFGLVNSYKYMAVPAAKLFWGGLNKAKGPIARGFKVMLGKALSFGGSMFDFGKKLFTDIVPNVIGKTTKFVKGVLGKVGNFAGKLLDPPRDLYIRGMDRPIMRANLMRMGWYLDRDTGKPIYKPSDINGPVVDRDGNIVLTAEDIGQGIVDAKGEEIKSMDQVVWDRLRTWSKYTIAATKAVGRVVGNTLKKGGRGLLEKIGGFEFELVPVLGISKNIYDVLVDIRHMLQVKFGFPITPPNHNKSDVEKTKEAETMAKKEEQKEKEEENSGEEGQKKKSSFWGKTKGTLGRIGGKAKGVFSSFKNKYFGGQPQEEIPEDVAAARSFASGGGGSAHDLATLAKRSKSANSFLGKTKGTLGRIGGKALRFGRGKFGLIAGLASTGLSMLGDVGGSIMGGLGKLLGDAGKGKTDEHLESVQVETSAEAAKSKDSNTNNKNRSQVNQVSSDPRYKSQQNAIDKLLGMSKGFFSSLLGGLGGLLNLGGNFLQFGAKGIVKGFKGLFKGGGKLLGAAGKVGKGFLKKIPGLGLALTATDAVYNLAKGESVGTVAKDVAMDLAISAGIGYLMGGGATMAAAASVVGTAAAAILPVALPLAAVAAVSYGIYKTVKYATRNDVDELQSIRMQQYGLSLYDEAGRDKIHIVLNLERYLMDGKLKLTNGKVELNTGKIDNKELCNIFDIDLNNVERITKLSKWLKDRFIPFFLKNMQSYLEIAEKADLNSAIKLEPAKKIEFLNKIEFDSGPYDITVSPFGDSAPILFDTKKETKVEIKKLVEKYQKEVKDSKKKESDTEMPGYLEQVAMAESGITYESRKDYNKKQEEKKKADEAVKNLLAENKEQEKAKAANLKTVAGPNVEQQPSVSGGTGGGATPSINTGGASGAAGVGAAQGAASIPLAAGELRDGSGADQYIVYNKRGVRLTGAKNQMVQLFRGMVQEYGEKTGQKVIVTSGYRSYEEQAREHAANPRKAAKPGRSLHEYGLAFDVNSKDLDAMEKLGLMKKYGFTRPVGGETWHIEPAGIQGNIDLARRDPNFAAKAIVASIGRGGGGVGILPGAAKYRRNTQYAKSLWGVNGPIVDESATANTNTENASVPPPATLPEQQQPKQEQVASAQDIIKNQNEKPAKTVEPNKDASQSTNTTPNTMPTDGETKQQTTSGGSSSESAGGSVAGSVPASKKDMIKLVETTAQKVGVDSKVVVPLVAQESMFDPNAGAKTSSAKGLYQFISDTWRGMLAKYGGKYGIPKNTSPYNPEANALMGAQFTKDNIEGLKAIKTDVNSIDAYMAHFLGPGGAKKLLSAIAKNPNTPASAVMDAGVLRANKNIFFENGRVRSVGEVYKFLQKKLQQRAKELGVNVDIGSSIGSGSGFNKESADATPSESSGMSSGDMLSGAFGGPSVTEGYSDNGATNQNNPSTGSSGGTGGGEFSNPSVTEGISNVSTSTPEQSSSDVTSILTQQLEANRQTVEILKEIREALKGGPMGMMNSLASMKDNMPNNLNPQGLIDNARNTTGKISKSIVNLSRTSV